MPGPKHAFAAVLLAVLVGTAAPVLSAEQRIALVIGNSAYASSRLINPVNDAKLMSQALRAQGFEVIERLDVGRVAMQLAITEVGNLLRTVGDATRIRNLTNFLRTLALALPWFR